MIALVLAMAWARRGQAVVLALLSMFGVAAAVAAPAYLRAADRAVAAGQVGTAPAGERSVSLVMAINDRRTGDDPSAADPSQLRANTALTALPGFRYTYAGQVNAIGMEADTDEPTRIVYRQDVCAHLRIAAGRCPIGESDVALGDRTARRLGLRLGQNVALTYAEYVDTPEFRGYRPRGVPKTFLVTGFYRAVDEGESYWGAHDYFVSREPAFVTEASLRGMDIGAEVLSVDGDPGPGALGVDRLPGIRAGLDRLAGVLTAQRTGIELRSGLPGLLARVDTGRAAVHRVVPVLAVALVLLAGLTIFLAAGYGTDARRPELAVIALRGARAPQRWWLGTGENAVAIVLGGLLGCPAGQLLVNAVAAVRFPGVGADPGLDSLRWAPVTIAAAVLTALLAERRQLTTGVLELLRRAPTVGGAARAVAFEVAVVLLAAAAAGQLVLSGGALTGVGTLATGLVLIAAALVAARLIMLGVTAYSRRALDRGRLGPALAGLHLARRPGGVRLLALLIAAVAVAGYAASAVDVAAAGRRTQASLGVGADRIVTVAPMAAQQLLAAVRRVDPDGRFAMAVVRLPTPRDAAPAVAVDTTRLGAVAEWPAGAPGTGVVAHTLRPAAGDPVRLTGTELSFDITASVPGADVTVRVSSGAGDQELVLGQMSAGRRTYTRPAAVCADGCLLDSIHVQKLSGARVLNATLQLHGITGGAWHSTTGGAATAGADGLRVAVNFVPGMDAGVYVQPADAPSPLPAVTAGGLTEPTVAGLDGQPLPVGRAVAVPVLPGIGTPGTLVDLDYADKLATHPDPATWTAQVWLAARAPADVLDRMRSAGLAPVGDRRAADVRTGLDHDGPALGLLFYALAGALAALLAAGLLTLTATVDRPRRVEDLTALRGQGLTAGDLRRATLWTYPVLAVIAVVAGTLIGLAGWWITGWALPPPGELPFSRWPSLPALAGVAASELALLAGVAVLAGRRTLSAIR